MKAPIALLLALTILLAGCGATESSSPDARAELESLITRQLPAKIKSSTGSGALVSGVGCVHSIGSTYECIATISGTNIYGEYTTEQISITGTCDQATCIWKVSP